MYTIIILYTGTTDLLCGAICSHFHIPFNGNIGILTFENTEMCTLQVQVKEVKFSKKWDMRSVTSPVRFSKGSERIQSAPEMDRECMCVCVHIKNSALRYHILFG